MILFIIDIFSKISNIFACEFKLIGWQISKFYLLIFSRPNSILTVDTFNPLNFLIFNPFAVAITCNYFEVILYLEKLILWKFLWGKILTYVNLALNSKKIKWFATLFNSLLNFFIVYIMKTYLLKFFIWKKFSTIWNSLKFCIWLIFFSRTSQNTAVRTSLNILELWNYLPIRRQLLAFKRIKFILIN